MNRNLHAIRVGLRRGWTEFLQSLRSPQDQGFYLFMALAVLALLWFNRENEIEATSLRFPQVAMPSILAGLIVLGIVIGPAYTLAMEREDGTLLRARAAPRGLQGYVAGQLLLHSLGLVPLLVTVVVPSMILFEGVMPEQASGWITVAWLLVLGTLSTLPIGIVIGSVVPSVQKVGTWGFLPVIGLVTISGILSPMQQLWGWIQVVAQLFPVYWVGHGMRYAFLPDAAVVGELGQTWRIWETVAVLSVWALAGALVAPLVLRRMARRQSGSQVEAAREAAVQVVR